jgi:hypothetical protein
VTIMLITATLVSIVNLLFFSCNEIVAQS